MKKSKHAPGPWDLIHWDKSKPGVRTIVADSIEDHICSIEVLTPEHPETHEMQMANARLMAASPELLKVLEKVDTFLKESDAPENMLIWQDVRKAIHKARGES